MPSDAWTPWSDSLLPSWSPSAEDPSTLMFDDEVSGKSALRQIRASEQIAQALATVEFPITKQELIVRLDGRWLEHDEETAAALSDILKGVAASRFSTAREAQRAVDQRWARVAKSLAAIERAEESQR